MKEIKDDVINITELKVGDIFSIIDKDVLNPKYDYDHFIISQEYDGYNHDFCTEFICLETGELFFTDKMFVKCRKCQDIHILR